MKKNKRTNVVSKLVLLFFVLAFLVITGRFLYIQVSGEVKDQNLKQLAKETREISFELEAERGKIHDSNGMILAYNRPTYRVFAILDENRKTRTNAPDHIVDSADTAKKLSSVLDIDEKEIKKKIDEGKEKGRFQIEFGTKGRKLPQEKKEEIEDLQLPGIHFLEDSIRYYPNGMFASHILGFARQNEEDETVGVTGIEKEMNESLSGKNGYIYYHRDSYGNKLLNPNEVVQKAENGHDIYLTIDQKVQTLLEDVLSQVDEQYEPEKIMAVVMNPKTGEIVAMSNRPSFNPNDPGKVKNWYNDVISSPFEQGSTMKIFTWAAAMEEGVYDGKEKFKSGKYIINEKVRAISDHNNGKGWGKISYDTGFRRSSNVASSKLIWEKMDPDDFLKYLKNFDFDKPTNIDLPSEGQGKILFDWPAEKLTTSFGQGSTTTAMQLIKAASAIANEGNMMQPYIIKKVVDSNTGEVVEENNPSVVGQPVSKETADKMMDLMASVVNSKDGTGKNYRLKDYTVAGKTGTAQIPNPDGDGYLPGKSNNMYSFVGVAPKDDPQLLMYVAVKQPKLRGDETGSEPVAFIFNNVIENGLHYLNIEPDKESDDDSNEHTRTMPQVIDKTVKQAKKDLENISENITVVGDGKNVLAVNINEDEEVVYGQHIMLITDKPTIPDLKGWSSRDVYQLGTLLEIDVKVKGNGFVTKQNIKKGSKIDKKVTLEVELKKP
ncbi:penicillin-binding transpeptidase domain-containing protein [Pseudogracilibacillus sp. ICA-222130]|uniref:penicillin-binding transpeptidase domain-containing protein n=1 Tax=Pseudogracilibacillus sp. ICA-222130 TaxID=3134655 RepID=UPI0030BDFB42